MTESAEMVVSEF